MRYEIRMEVQPNEVHEENFDQLPSRYKTTHLSIMIIIINLIYIAQFDTNGILTALKIVITYIQMQYVPI